MLDNRMIEVGWHKGEADFRVSGAVADLTFEKMQELRAMIPVAIAQLERMFMIGVEGRDTTQCAESK